MGFNTFERWCIVAIWAGGLGNMIDRIRLGYVVDMVNLEFVNFPVFNVADCFITCGCIAMLISLVFFNRSIWKDEKKEKAEEAAEKEASTEEAEEKEESKEEETK